MLYFAIAPFAVFAPCLIVLLSRAFRRPDRLNGIAQLWSHKVAAMKTAEHAQKFLASFGGTKRAAEQAQIFLAQGQTCRAAAIYLNIVRVEPTAENLTMLAEVYMEQGLHDDAVELHLRVLQMKA